MFWVTENVWVTETCFGLLKNGWVTEKMFWVTGKCSGAPNEPGCLGLPKEPENQNLLGSMSLGAAWGCPSGLGARICWGKCCLKLSGPAQWAWELKSAVEHAAWGCQWTGGDQPADAMAAGAMAAGAACGRPVGLGTRICWDECCLGLPGGPGNQNWLVKKCLGY